MPNTHFIEIMPRSRPALIPRLDEAGRTLYTANYDTRCVDPAVGMYDCVARIISNAGYGVENVSLFVGVSSSAATLMIQVLATGGFSSERYHTDGEIERNSFQVLVRSVDALQAENTSISIWYLLKVVQDTHISF